MIRLRSWYPDLNFSLCDFKKENRVHGFSRKTCGKVDKILIDGIAGNVWHLFGLVGVMGRQPVRFRLKFAVLGSEYSI